MAGSSQQFLDRRVIHLILSLGLVDLVICHNLMGFKYQGNCHFPFVKDNQLQYKCSDMGGGVSMCNKQPNYDSDTDLDLCLIKDYCRETLLGIGYVGEHGMDQHTRSCVQWNWAIDDFPDINHQETSDYCRNPDYWDDGLWCYNTAGSWDLCDDIPYCSNIGGKLWCDDELGVTGGDSVFTASSITDETDQTYLVSHARMDNVGATGAGAWYPLTQDPGEWIQITFPSYHKVWALGLAGAPGSAEFVTSFQIAYTPASDAWADYMDPADPDTVMTFAGCSDDTIPVGVALNPAIRGYDIRFYPQTWVGSRIAMRVEATGCSDSSSCSSGPCLNGATCYNEMGLDRYTCVCPNTFTGDRCETAIDADCQSNPCKNGATCVSGGGSYSCTCATGYAGGDCETLTGNYESCIDVANAGITTSGNYAVNLYASLLSGTDCTIKTIINMEPVSQHTAYYSTSTTGEACQQLCLGESDCTAAYYESTNCNLYNDTTVLSKKPRQYNGYGGSDYYEKECPGQVTIHCDLTDPTNPVASLKPYQPVIDAWGYEYPGSNFDVSYYPATMAQVNEFVRISTSCSQDLTLHCKGSTAMYYDLEFLNGDQVNIRNGGDGDCACYLDGQCVDNGETECVCNVDSVGAWRKDYGTVADITKKGLKAIKVGDTGHRGEEGVLVVGPIVCAKTTADINECDSNPCQNGGTCNDHYYYYNCTCPSGFTGELCEINIDECASSPCHNGATCQDGNDGYSCYCITGFTGIHCETNIDDCDPYPCQNQASCIDGIDDYDCGCRPGYMGVHCQLDVDECDSDPCQNNAPCTEAINDYTCACPSGYTGKNCETLINECDSNPCLNGATCNDELDAFTCSCVAGYQGTLCGTDTDDCQTAPCNNGGTCTDLLDGFSCACRDGWMGQTCSNSVNECASNPCQNEARCDDLHLSYQCICEPGWSGLHCDQGIDECASSPCLNGATCVDGLNSYTCSCRPGFIGTHCQTESNECVSLPCQNSGTCVDLVNGFRCNCRTGFGGDVCEILTIDGNWGDWGPWGSCTRQCGEGVRTREHFCDNPPPFPPGEGQTCAPPATEQMLCIGIDCTNVDGGWSLWSGWGACTATCGTGTKTNRRYCNNPPQRGTGAPCEGAAEGETEQTDEMHCEIRPCGEPVDGEWGSWGPWTGCSATCGLGTDYRQRTCTDPPPAFGGQDCPDEKVGVRPCEERQCPEYGDWGEWEEWSLCSKTCGDGIRMRSRTGHLLAGEENTNIGDGVTVANLPEKVVWNLEHCEDMPCGGTEEDEIMECITCESEYDGTVRSLECRGPTMTCTEDKPHCRYSFIKKDPSDINSFAGVRKGCASSTECNRDLVEICDDWILQIINSIQTENKENWGWPLTPNKDTVIQMYDKLPEECHICCDKAGCNVGILPGTVHDGTTRTGPSKILLTMLLMTFFVLIKG